MARSLSDHGGAAQSPWLEPFHCRSLIHCDLFNEETINIDRLLFLSRIGNGRF